MLIFFFSDNICQLINTNLNKSYEDLESLVREKINKDKLGNSTSILAARYDSRIDIEKFVTNKFSVFKLNNFDSTQIKLWLDIYNKNNNNIEVEDFPVIMLLFCLFSLSLKHALC